MRRISLLSIAAALLLPALVYGSTTQIFSDIPEDHELFDVTADLHRREIFQGYDDGSFQPNKFVNRAETAKIIVKPISLEEQVGEFEAATYTDVPTGAWFFPYVERAHHVFGIIDGPPKTTTFYGERTVNKVELLKMLLLAYNIDPAEYSDITAPLAVDVMSADEWFYPYVRFALSAGMIDVENGTVNPGENLTRGQIAQIMYNFFQYRDRKQGQELVNRIERDLLLTLQMLQKELYQSADRTSTRALLFARGASVNEPKSSIIKGYGKITRAIRYLVEAYEMSREKDIEGLSKKADLAWEAAEEAKAYHLALSGLAREIQTTASVLREEAYRGLLSE